MNTSTVALSAGTILSGVVGSTAHGLHVEGSDDTDYMAVYVEPPETVFSWDRVEHQCSRTAGQGERSRPGDVDIMAYSLRKFLRLCVQGNPTVLTLLFTPTYEALAPGLKLLTVLPRLVVAKSAAKPFLGYLESQRRKLLENRGLPNRPELVCKHGYDTKYAMHMARLAWQGVEFLSHGRLELPMSPTVREQLQHIRAGEALLGDVLSWVGAMEQTIRDLGDGLSVLPDVPDVEGVKQLSVELHKMQWGWL